MGRCKNTKSNKAIDGRFPKAGKKTSDGKNKFSSAVVKCDEIKDAFKPGLSALKSNSVFVKADDTNLIQGSVDIDAAVKDLYPEDPRWDYVIGYAEEAVFVEIHPAATSNVDEMVKKVKWLKNWLRSAAADLNELHTTEIYYWIPSGGVSILKGSVQARRIALNHLCIKKIVNLP